MASQPSPRLRGSENQAGGSVLWYGMLAGLGRTEAADGLAARLRKPVAWPAILAESRRLRVTPLFYAGLQTAAAGAVPQAVLETLRRTALASGARSVRLEQAAAAVIEAASSEKIPILVLKGLALQHLAYPGGVARPMDDVDLLVPPAEAPRLARLLRRRGYRTDFRGEEDFFSPDLSHSIDLHTSLVNTTRLPARGLLWDEPFPALWRRRQPLALAGVSAWTLGPQGFIQHLAVHAVHHHGMQGALWMADLLAALQTWPLACEATRGAPAAVRRSVWYCLEALAAHGHDPIPEVRAVLRPRRLFPGERRVLARVAHGECSVHIRYGFTLACLPRWADRIKFARQLLFPADGMRATGCADGGPPSSRHAWMAHWADLTRLAVSRRLHW